MKIIPKYQLALVGYPLTHSFSKSYFKSKFIAMGIYSFIKYYNFPTNNPSKIAEIQKYFPNLIGMNVTMPYKKEILKYIDKVEGMAKEIKNVNTVVITEKEKIGFNTDYIGLYHSLIKLLKKNKCSSALILGTGASSLTTQLVLQRFFNCNNIIFASRTPTKSNHINYSEINLKEFELIVNTTPVGMFPDTELLPPIPTEQLNESHYVLDLIYNPPETKLLRLAKRQGAKTLNGLTMLIWQAEYAWKIWTKFYPTLR